MNESDWRSRARLGSLILLGSLVLGGGLWLTAPTPKHRPLRPRQPLVTVHALTPQQHRLRLQAHGRVQPLTRVELVPEVTGRIVALHRAFVPGGRVPKGEPLVRLDAREYEAAAAIAAANLSTAEEELALEAGRQRAALAELRQFDARKKNISEQERDLATRGPQRRMREAAVERARATLTRAQLDVERCAVRLPYDAVVETVAAAPGSHNEALSFILTRLGQRCEEGPPEGLNDKARALEQKILGRSQQIALPQDFPRTLPISR